MPAESLKSERSDPIPMPMAAAWPTLMKSPPNEGEELMKAEKNVMDTKAAVVESKKMMSCICSPTTHAGSFRCHLHRATAPRISSCSTSVANSTSAMRNSLGNKLNSKSQSSHQPIPSRFGRASSLKPKAIPEDSLLAG